MATHTRRASASAPKSVLFLLICAAVALVGARWAMAPRQTPAQELWQASAVGDTARVRALLARGADPNAAPAGAGAAR